MWLTYREADNMPSYSSLFATALLVAASSAAPAEKRDANNPSIVQGLLGTDGYWNEYDGGTNAYNLFKGDGGHDAGWPYDSHWVSFNDMWTINHHLIERSCDEKYKVPNNSPTEMQDLKDAINQVAHESRVDHRFILAMVLQESGGCVRAESLLHNDGSTNSGMLQALSGGYTCNEKGHLKNPCGKEWIVGQIRDGIEGTTKGHGIAEDINEQASFVNGNVAQAYYRAARLYDSGSIDGSNALEKAKVGEKCYASDVANLLMGWVDAAYTCDLDK